MGLGDRIQYPRETLQQKSGNREDLVALYASALESVGIPTTVIIHPDRLLLMFCTEIMDGESGGNAMDHLFVAHEGLFWVPVDVSFLGQSFIRAWEEGSRQYESTKDSGGTRLRIQEAWGTVRPATLASPSWMPAEISRTAIKKRFPGDIKAVQALITQFKGDMN